MPREGREDDEGNPTVAVFFIIDPWINTLLRELRSFARHLPLQMALKFRRATAEAYGGEVTHVWSLGEQARLGNRVGLLSNHEFRIAND